MKCTYIYISWLWSCILSVNPFTQLLLRPRYIYIRLLSFNARRLHYTRQASVYIYDRVSKVAIQVSHEFNSLPSSYTRFFFFFKTTKKIKKKEFFFFLKITLSRRVIARQKLRLRQNALARKRKARRTIKLRRVCVTRVAACAFMIFLEFFVVVVVGDMHVGENSKVVAAKRELLFSLSLSFSWCYRVRERELRNEKFLIVVVCEVIARTMIYNACLSFSLSLTLCVRKVMDFCFSFYDMTRILMLLN